MNGNNGIPGNDCPNGNINGTHGIDGNNINGNDCKSMVEAFEARVAEDLTSFLQREGALDPHVPQCPDVEEKWGELLRAYFPEGAREFQEYPVASLLQYDVHRHGHGLLLGHRLGKVFRAQGSV